MRLSHLTALAVMIALVGAMFVALSSIGAQAAEPKVGDIAVPTTTPATSVTSAPAGFCVDPDPDVDTDQPIVRTTQAVGGVAIQVYAPDNSVDADDSTAGHQDDDGDALDLMNINCLASDHEKRVSVSPNGTTTPNVTVSDPNALLLLGRSVVSNDKSSEVSLRLLVLNFATNDQIVDATPGGDPTAATTPNDNTAEVDWIRVSGVLDGVDDFDESTIEKDNLDVTWLSAATGFADMDLTQKIVVPKGTPEGEYTITARIIFDRAGEDNERTTDTDEENAVLGSADDGDEEIIAEATLTVGDPGDAVSGATLSLGNEKEDNPYTTASELKEEKGVTEADGGFIWLKLTSLNSLDAPSNGGDVSSVTVLGPGGALEIFKAGKYASGKVVDHLGATRSDAGSALDDDANSVSVDDPETSTLFIKVGKADDEPGTVDVSAIIVGGGGKADSETITVIFGGSGETLEIGEAIPVAKGAKTEFSVNAMDSGGNDASIGQLTFRVTDADGDAVSGTHVFVEHGRVGDSTTTTVDDDPNAHAGIVTVGNKAEPGVYTVAVTLAGASGSTTTTTVTVAGAPSDVALVADPETGDAANQDVIKVTATVSDENGAPAVDGTLVEFSILGRSLAAIGPGHAPITTRTEKQLINTAGPDEAPEFEERTLTITEGGAKTKDGEVTVSFVVVGAGTAVVDATTEGGSASGVLRIRTSDTEATDSAMPEEEASVSCLSELSGFATWSCGVEADASEIFDMVSGRGVTALHLWNGSTWVRYSVVDGAMVPGSSDFMVTKSDILYISN